MTNSEVSRAAVLTGAMRIELTEFPLPRVDHDDALLAVAASGICGSDIHYRAEPDIYPRVLGHEVTGHIAAIGDTAAQNWGVSTGDLVAVESEITCGLCHGCLHGRYCTRARYYGASIPVDVAPSLWGGLAQHMYLAPRSVVTRLDPAIPVATAGGWFSPLTNAVDWIGPLGADVQPADTVVILGPGPQGIAACIVAKTRGAAQVIIVGLRRDEARLRAALELGADHIVVADEESTVEAVTRLTDGELADSVLDVSGADSSAQVAAHLVKRGGAIAAAAPLNRPGVMLPVSDMVMKQVRWHGMRSNRAAAAPVAAWLLKTHAAQLGPLVTHTFPLEATSAAIDAIEASTPADGNPPIKVVVCP
jgi:threonine dehydrogenase-like Zn-dependent dehydrogenase